jgi:VanZ family protein
MKHRQKLTLIALLVYWPTIFILAHIPIPKFVYDARVSDKAIHVLVYLILVFLFWFIVSPTKRVNWRKAPVWCVLIAMVAYSIADEVLQIYVNRNCDIADFLANMAGVLTGLIIFTFVSFWSAFLIVTAISIFLLANLTGEDPMKLMPIRSLLFYILLALLWIRHINSHFALKARQLKWIPIVLSIPSVLLLSVELFSIIIGRGIRPWRLTASAVGVVVVVTVIGIISHRTKLSAGQDLSTNRERPI